MSLGVMKHYNNETNKKRKFTYTNTVQFIQTNNNCYWSKDVHSKLRRFYNAQNLSGNRSFPKKQYNTPSLYSTQDIVNMTRQS